MLYSDINTRLPDVRMWGENMTKHDMPEEATFSPIVDALSSCFLNALFQLLCLYLL